MSSITALNDASGYAVASARAEKKLAEKKLATSTEGKDKRQTGRNARSDASKKQKNKPVLETPVLRMRRKRGGRETDEERHDEESTSGVRSGSDADDEERNERMKTTMPMTMVMMPMDEILRKTPGGPTRPRQTTWRRRQ